MRSSRTFIALALGSALLLAPLTARSEEARRRHGDIEITADKHFTKANGVVSGRGTTRDPYVISGWDIHRLEIRDTSKAIVIEDNTIHNLILNWTGARTDVRHNEIGDLRVNENIERTGMPTSGRIEHNTFDVVGQLRHFDGMFMHNTVGTPRGNGAWAWDILAVNFDGFNGAHFAHNTIHGYMDARLHGHHHSSGFGEASHMHAEKASKDGHGHHDAMDHSKRWHEVVIEHNTIHTTNYYALAYLDTIHSVNDRTAESETEETLNDPHVHHTRVHIMDNELIGAGIRVEVFNAVDELHERYARGLLHLEGNSISIERGAFHPFESKSGIEVWQARNLRLRIEDTVVTATAPSGLWPAAWQKQGAGIVLSDLHRARVTIDGLTVANKAAGVQASNFTKSVSWAVTGLVTRGVDQPVWHDETAGSPKTD